VVDAPNEAGKLLPGMTATVDFYVEERKNVLVVPATALSLKPTQEMVDQLRKARAGSRPADAADQAPDTTRRRRRATGDSSAAGLRPEQAANAARLWYLDAQGQPAAMPVRVGATDGRNTEVTALRGELVEGMKVIVKTAGTPASTRGRGPGGLGGRAFGH
jgi:HlyD family secretion protein